MLLSPHPLETASLFRTDLEDLQSIYTTHGIPFGTPPDLIAFPRTLSLNQGLGADLAMHVAAIQRRGAGRLSLTETVTILVLSLGGTDIHLLETTGIPIEEATDLLSSFLINLGGWTRADLGLAPRSRPPAPQAPEPIELNGPPETARPYLVPRDQVHSPEAAQQSAPEPQEDLRTPLTSGSSMSTAGDLDPGHSPKISPVAPDEPASDASAELSDDELQTRLHDETPEAEPASAVAELNEVLSRLELTSIELKHHLDSIDQRISRMEPRIESMPSILAPSPSEPPVPPNGFPKGPPPGNRFASAGHLDRSRTALPAKPDLPAPPVADAAKWPTPAAISPEASQTPAPAPISASQGSSLPTPAILPQPASGSGSTANIGSHAEPGPVFGSEDRRNLLRSFETSAPPPRSGFSRRRQKIVLAASALLTLLGFGGAIFYLLDPDLSRGITIGSYTFGAENPYRSRGASIPKPAAPPPAPAKVPATTPPSVEPPGSTGRSTSSTSAPSTMVLDSPVPHVNVYSARHPKPGSLLTTSDSPSGRVNVPSAIMASRLDSARLPVYPRTASLIHLQGVVVLQAYIGKNGTVQSVKPLGGHRLLRGAAVDAVRKWHYRPYFVDGHPVEVSTVVSVDFLLNRQ